MRLAIAVIFAILGTLPPCAWAGKQLEQPFPLALGEVAALSASQYLALAKLGGATDVPPMLATYDRLGQALLVWVYGDSSTTDAARQSLESLWRFQIVPMRSWLQGVYGVEFGESEVTVVYLSGVDRRELLRREKGAFVAPKSGSR